MKNNTVALSFGYLATKTRRRRDGIQDLLEIDLFEITVAPGPANPETRFLNLKTAGDGRISTDAELRSEAKRLGVEPPPSGRELRRKSGEIALEAALGWRPPPEASREPVGVRADDGRAAQEIGPAQVGCADAGHQPRGGRGSWASWPDGRRIARAGSGARGQGSPPAPAHQLCRRHQGKRPRRDARPPHTQRCRLAPQHGPALRASTKKPSTQASPRGEGR